MPTVKIEPTDEYPVPYDTSEEELDNFADKLASAANTAELLVELGAPVEVDPATLAEEKKLLDSVIDKQKTAPLKNLPTALGAASFLRAYGQSRALDIDQVRAALTNKLLEIADCGERACAVAFRWRGVRAEQDVLCGRLWRIVRTDDASGSDPGL